MLKMSRLTDYGTMLLAQLAQPRQDLMTAAALAQATRLGKPTVSKLLKTLTKAHLVRSVRGANGGYALARSADTISAAEIIDALEGPVAITECSVDSGHCELAAACHVGSAWQRINRVIREALDDVSLEDLRSAPQPLSRIDFHPQTTPSALGRTQ